MGRVRKKIKLNCEKLIDNDNYGFKVKTWIIGTDKQTKMEECVPRTLISLIPAKVNRVII